MASKGMTVDEAISDMRKRREKAVEEAIIMIEADAKLLSRVKTGNLRRSITHETHHDDSKSIGAVGSNVEYAAIEEYRTGFLSEATDINLERIRLKIAEVLKNG